MKVYNLIKELSKYAQNLEVSIYDYNEDEYTDIEIKAQKVDIDNAPIGLYNSSDQLNICLLHKERKEDRYTNED